MTEVQKTHVRFDWVLAPKYQNARYYDVYASPRSIPLLVLIGVTKGTNSDRIYPLNYTEFCELKTNHFAYDSEMSIKEYLQDSTFPFILSDSDMAEILEYLKQHAPKPAYAEGYGVAKEGS